MLNQSQESLMVGDRAHTLRPALVQLAIGLVLVIATAAFGLFTASHANGQERAQAATAKTEKVLPDLVIWPEALEPNLSGMLATGDGGDVINLQAKPDSGGR